MQNLPIENSSIFSNGINDWGPKRDPLVIVIPITSIYILIFFSGLIGNLSTCIVISRNKSMHTATNYYLFSLAISDLLLLISGLPPEIYSIWSKYPYIFGEVFCVMQGFAAETSANATVLTITAFTIERYVAICHPFLSHTLSKLQRAIKFIIAIWIVAMCLAIPQAMALGIVYEHLPNGEIISDHCVCIIKRSVIPYAFELSTLLFFIAPMSLITVLYILIGLQLHKSTVQPSRGNSIKLKHRICKPNPTHCAKSADQTGCLMIDGKPGNEKGNMKNSEDDEDGRKNFGKNAQATKYVVKMLVAVVVAFFICWAPFHAQRLLAIYGEHTSSHMIKAFQVLTYTSGVLYYLSTTVNPLLYHIMSHKFREAFKNTYKQLFGRKRNPLSDKCYATLSGRSSQLNSHSNTDSCSRQSSLRYLEAEMARLHDSERPLIVSFKKKKPFNTERHVLFKYDTNSTSLNNLNYSLINSNSNSNNNNNNNNSNNNNNNNNNNNSVHHYCTTSFVEVHQLEPTHKCPMKNSSNNELNNFNLYRKQTDYNKQINLNKSSTMPDIGRTKIQNQSNNTIKNIVYT